MTNAGKYVAPSFNAPNFSCPHCGDRAGQTWGPETGMGVGPGHRSAICGACGKHTVWSVRSELLYHLLGGGSPGHPETPLGISPYFEEARQVVNTSPRAAGALLRLAIESLVKEKSRGDERLNIEIGNLVRSGDLSPQVQKALDLVRYHGASMQHPGLIDDSDTSETIAPLFELVNLVVEDLIARPKHLSSCTLRSPRACGSRSSAGTALALGPAGPETRPSRLRECQRGLKSDVEPTI